MKYLLTSFIALFGVTPAFAYYTATAAPAAMDVNKRTHVLIVGNGSEAGNTMLEASAAQAKKYQEVYPNDQVYLIAVNEKGSDDDLKNFEFLNVVRKSSSLKSEDVLNELTALSKIASIDVFSHSVAYYGVILDGKFSRLDPKADGYQKLAGHFTEDAYGFLHGCNSGQFLAGIFSYQWGIPVAGSYTGTDFQFITDKGQFFNEDSRMPKDAKKVNVNKTTYQKNVGCYSGACVRLFPDNNVYHGYWGDFTGGGLGFYKWLCANNSISDEKCFRSMARAVLTYVSVKPLKETSSLEDYKDVVFDFLCPIGKRDECRAALEKSEVTGQRTYDPYDGKTLQCNFKGCKAKISCEHVPGIDLLKSGSCTVENLRESNKTTTLVDEYTAYIKGYKLLQQEIAAKK